MNWMDNISSSLLYKDLDGLWTRQQAISDNMANFETPGYKQKSVSFENQLRTEMENADCTPDKTIADIENVSPAMEENSDRTYRADGNGVDLEQQMIDMYRTATNYSYSLQLTNDYFSRLNTAISGTVK